MLLNTIRFGEFERDSPGSRWGWVPVKPRPFNTQGNTYRSPKDERTGGTRSQRQLSLKKKTLSLLEIEHRFVGLQPFSPVTIMTESSRFTRLLKSQETFTFVTFWVLEIIYEDCVCANPPVWIFWPAIKLPDCALSWCGSRAAQAVTLLQCPHKHTRTFAQGSLT